MDRRGVQGSTDVLLASLAANSFKYNMLRSGKQIVVDFAAFRKSLLIKDLSDRRGFLLPNHVVIGRSAGDAGDRPGRERPVPPGIQLPGFTRSRQPTDLTYNARDKHTNPRL